MKTLDSYIERITDIDLKSCCRMLARDPEFPLWPAAISHHHNYPGGLLIHTLEVTELAIHAAASFPEVNLDILIAACLWHDYAKVHEYEVVTHVANGDPPADSLRYRLNESGIDYWVKSDYLKKIGHIAGSTASFNHAAVTCAARHETTVAVCHCILAHHGPVKEWGSPVAPQTLEAYLLHHADMLSARFGATKDKAP